MTATRVLFVSTSNAARSILAEAILRRVGGEGYEAFSAGIDPTEIHPLTRRVLEEAGFDHDWAQPKHVDDFSGQDFDYVVTLCDDARLVCPVFPGADTSYHWGYPSPASVQGEDDIRLAAFQRVFTDLGTRIRQFVVVTGSNRPVATG